MDKKIRYKQTVRANEYYSIDYTLHDFEYDCECYGVEGVSFDDLCGVLNGTKPDFIIRVTEFYDDGLYGTHLTSVLDFFSRRLAEQSFDQGYQIRNTLEIVDKEIRIEDN